MTNDELKELARKRKELHEKQKTQHIMAENSEVVALKGEDAFCHAFYVKLDKTLRIQGNRGREYILTHAACPICNMPNCIHGRPTVRARVRTQSYYSKEMYFVYKDKRGKPTVQPEVIYVCAYWNEHKDRVRFWGWIRGADILKLPHSVHPKTVDNYTVQRDSLQPMDKLFKLCGLPTDEGGGQLGLF